MKIKELENKKYNMIAGYVIAVATMVIIIYNVIDSVPFYFKVILEKTEWLMKASRPIILALVFTYLLDPIADVIEQALMKKTKFFSTRYKKARVIAVITVILLVLAFIAGLLSLIIYSITDKVRLAKIDDIYVVAQNFATSINDLYHNILERLSKVNVRSAEVNEYVTKALKTVLTKVTEGSTAVLSSVSGITGFLGELFFALIMTIYFLIDENLIKGTVDRIARALFSDKSNKRMRFFVNEADTVFSGYIRGQFMDAFFMMVMISLVLSIIGVKFGIIIGICAGIGNLIPYFGPFVAYGGVLLVCGFSGEFKRMIIALIALVVVQAIDGNIIGPKLLSNCIEIHPLIVIISLVLGSAIGGFLGMLLAVPVGALIKVLFMYYIDRKISEKESRVAAAQPVVSENANEAK